MKILLFHSKKFPLTDSATDIINKNFVNHNFKLVNSYESLIKELPDTDIFITGKFTKEMLEYAKNLKWVNALSAGIDNYDLDLFRNNHIIFTNSSGMHKIQMAEYAIMSMIMLVRKMSFFMKNQYNKIWDFNINQSEISGKTLGILGLGSIGMQTAKYAGTMGMKVIGINSSGIRKNDFISEAYTLNDLDTVLKNSDFLINLLPSSNETKYLLSSEKIKLMKKTSYFINMGRGDIIKNDTLYDVLKNNIISGAVSDVFDKEPLSSDSPLWNLENLIITPHICGSSDIYMEKALKLFLDNFNNYINNDKMFNIIK